MAGREPLRSPGPSPAGSCTNSPRVPNLSGAGRGKRVLSVVPFELLLSGKHHMTVVYFRLVYYFHISLCTHKMKILNRISFDFSSCFCVAGKWTQFCTYGT